MGLRIARLAAATVTLAAWAVFTIDTWWVFANIPPTVKMAAFVVALCAGFVWMQLGRWRTGGRGRKKPAR